jgi:molybdate transport system substrate-binding protein
MTEVLRVLIPRYEQRSGNTVVVRYDIGSVLAQRIQNGEAFDAAILPVAALDPLAASGLVDRTTVTPIARSGIGLAYRSGAPAPDIHDTAAFRGTILAARSIAYVSGGASGAAFLDICRQLGIDRQVQAKAHAVASGPAALVVNGQADFATQQISELLAVAGVTVVPFPPELQRYTTFTGSVATASAQHDAAVDFLRFLADPANVPVLQAKGMIPPAALPEPATPAPSPTPSGYVAHGHLTMTLGTAPPVRYLVTLERRGHHVRAQFSAANGAALGGRVAVHALVIVGDGTAHTVTIWSPDDRRVYAHHADASPASTVVGSTAISPFVLFDTFSFTFKLVGHGVVLGIPESTIAADVQGTMRMLPLGGHVHARLQLADDASLLPLRVDLMFSGKVGPRTAPGVHVAFAVDQVTNDVPDDARFVAPAGYLPVDSLLQVLQLSPPGH